MKNPSATITIQNGAKIVLELLPELAPNTVNSFIFLAQHGVFDDYPIARVEPGFVVDVSTNAYGKEISCYLIANEATHADAACRLAPDLGVIAMGGYDGRIAGGEFFFPLAPQPQLDGNYPCFGRVVAGLAEIVRIGRLPVRAFRYNHAAAKTFHRPLETVKIATVRVETFGVDYPEPQRLHDVALPPHWLMEDYEALI